MKQHEGQATVSLDPNDPPVLPTVPTPNPLRQVLKVLASLRLTVVLFSLAMLLVFFGTLAQIRAGIWTVVDEYFYSWYVLVPFQLVAEFLKVFLGPFGFPHDAKLGGVFVLPGGKLLGWALLINLLAAHMVRFRFTWKRSGILIIHSGVVVLLLGEFVTREYAVEATMTLAEGERCNFVDESREVELAFVDSSDPAKDDVVVVPEALLRRYKNHPLIRHESLPVDVRVTEYHPNSRALEVREAGPDTFESERMDGQTVLIRVEPRGEEAGVDPNARRDAPMARVTLLEKGTENVLGTYLVSLQFYPNFTNRVYGFEPQTVKANGKTYAVELRPRRTYKPYVLELIDFVHDVYPGTETPKDFASTLRVMDAERGEDTTVRIWMNNPLRFRGETFYQSGFLPGDRGTVLQVVKNPGFLMPYISCAMISGGMLIHFGIILVGFLRRRFA